MTAGLLELFLNFSSKTCGYHHSSQGMSQKVADHKPHLRRSDFRKCMVLVLHWCEAVQAGHSSGCTMAPRDTGKPGTQGAVLIAGGPSTSYSVLSNGLCSFWIISTYHCCIQTQVDDLPLVTFGYSVLQPQSPQGIVKLHLRYKAYSVLSCKHTHSAFLNKHPPKVRREQCLSVVGCACPFSIGTDLHTANSSTFSWCAVLWPWSLLLLEAHEMQETFSNRGELPGIEKES